MLPHLTLDLPFIAQDVALPGQDGIDLAQADKGSHLLQDFLFVRVTQGHVLGDKVRQEPHVPAVHDPGDYFLRKISGKLGILVELAPGLAQQSFRPGALSEGFGGVLLRQDLHISLQVGLRLPEAAHTGAAAALHDHTDRGGGKTENLRNVGNGAHLVEVSLRGGVDADLLLCDKEDVLVCFHGPLQGGDGDAALHVEGQIHMGENRQATEGQNGNIQSNRFHRGYPFLGMKRDRGRDFSVRPFLRCCFF